MEPSLGDNARPHSVGNVKSPFHVSIKRHPKHHAALKVAACSGKAKGAERKVRHLLKVYLLYLMKKILHPMQLPFLLVDAVWVTNLLVPSWNLGHTALYVMGGFMYLMEECWFWKKQKDGSRVKLEFDKFLCQNFDFPRSSDEQVTDGVHRLVIVMHSGDPEQEPVSESVLEHGTEEPLDLEMEQLV